VPAAPDAPDAPDAPLVTLVDPPVPCDVAVVLVVTLVAPPAPVSVVLVPAVLVDVVPVATCPPPPVVRDVPSTSPEQLAKSDPHTTSDVVQLKCKIPSERRNTLPKLDTDRGSIPCT